MSLANPTNLYTLMAGGMAGVFSWLFTFPIDVIKSRLQADGVGGVQKYNGIRDCTVKSLQTEGVVFLYRGLVSSLVRAFPMNAACFLVVSWIVRYANSVTPTVPHVTYPPHLKDSIEMKKRKISIARSLVLAGVFNEAMCFSEILELM